MAYLAVDALDEYEDRLPELLSLISETADMPESRVNWIVTSRNKNDIDQHLALEDSRARLSLKINAYAVSRAIETCIYHKVSQVASLRSNAALRGNVRRKLSEQADGTFLWVDLVLRTIRKALSKDVLRVINL